VGVVGVLLVGRRLAPLLPTSAPATIATVIVTRTAAIATAGRIGGFEDAGAASC
jgi:hypothetical protein